MVRWDDRTEPPQMDPCGALLGATLGAILWAILGAMFGG